MVKFGDDDDDDDEEKRPILREFVWMMKMYDEDR